MIMFYIDIFPEPDIKRALDMLKTYRDKIDDFIILPGCNRIIPCLQWAVLNTENPVIGNYYNLYTKLGNRASTLKVDPLLIYWIDKKTFRLSGYSISFMVIQGKIHPFSSEDIKQTDSLIQLLFK